MGRNCCCFVVSHFQNTCPLPPVNARLSGTAQNSAEGTNTYSTEAINWSVPDGSVFKSGGIIEIDTVYNAWHWVRGACLPLERTVLFYSQFG